MRLGGWQRIGVIASAVWAVYGAAHGNAIGLGLGDGAYKLLDDCLATPGSDVSACLNTFHVDYAAMTSDHWLCAVLWAFVPVLLAWSLVWVVRRLAAWVQRGFAPAR